MKKGRTRIIFGWILVGLQFLAILGSMKSGSVPFISISYPTVESMMYDYAFLASFYFVGIVGTVLLISGYRAKKGNNQSSKWSDIISKLKSTINFKRIAVFSAIGIVFFLCVFAYYAIDAKIDESYDVGYEDGHVEGYEDGFSDGKIDGIYAGLQSDTKETNKTEAEYLFLGLLMEAQSYAEEKSDNLYFWEAMDIVSVYLDGYDQNGDPLPTRKEFEEAASVILDYAFFLEYYAYQLE